MNLPAAAALGLGLGIVTGMPLGVINVAIVDAAVARRPRYAAGLGVGGGLADSIHATLAFIGVGRLLVARPELVRVLAIGAAVAIAAYAVTAWRQHRRPSVGDVPDVSSLRGIATGATLTLVNPGALGAWVAIAAAVWPHARTLEAATIGTSVGIGSIAWFVLLARGVGRIRADHPALRWVPRIAAGVLVAIAIAGVARAL